MPTNLTDKEKASFLKQLADNNHNVHQWCSEIVADASATTIQLGKISFPYKITVLSARINALAATSTAFVVTATDGTSSVVVTLAANSTYKYDKEDATINADTPISITAPGIAGYTTANFRFMFDYIIDERRTV